MTSYTIKPAVGAVCRCKEKAGLRRSLRCLHTRTRLSSLLRLNLSLKSTGFHSAAVQLPLAWHRDPKCPPALCEFLMMWRSSRRLVCRGHPDPDLRVNDISRIHWSQHLLSTQSATGLADHPASIMSMLHSLSNCDSCSYFPRKRRNDMSTSALPS
ncbi:uncharacterized protein TNCV_3506511 [Trichonephila clavipes]|uniref:Uncharacterized protein n=1 Tax=Trichonephila clavipes TaxID=2585209 RepID=A0A8X6RY02_TRICX|nr:uncharacterized protein TNCV_3506511 [Trichonephila clavipes]